MYKDGDQDGDDNRHGEDSGSRGLPSLSPSTFLRKCHTLTGPTQGVKYSPYGGRMLNICPLLVLPRSISPSPWPALAGSPANLLRHGPLL